MAGIFRGINTDNASVNADMLDAAAAMPANVAATLVPKIRGSLGGTTFWYGREKAAALCNRLAFEGETQAALDLADTLFDPRFLGGEAQRLRGDGHWYVESLEKVTPALVLAAGREFCERLVSWLGVSIDLREHADRITGQDYSFVWRPAIEEHDENDDADFSARLVGILRQSLEQAVEGGQLSLADAFAAPARTLRRIQTARYPLN